MSRLTSIVVFALVAQRVDASSLGAFSVATVISSASLALAPALVGKPLANLAARGAPVLEASQAQSAAVIGSVLASTGLLVAALASEGLVRLTLLSAAIGVPAVMIVESTFWRDVFTGGSRRAGGLLSAAYAVQALGVVTAALTLHSQAVVLSPFVTLLVVGVSILLGRRGLSAKGAWVWVRDRRPSWLPYVLGVAAGVLLVQAIPVVITATAGFESASVYRAGELAFGGTNLLIGIATQNLLARGTDRPRATYVRFTAALSVVAVLNGLVLALVPDAWLRLLVGPAEPLLREVLLIVTIQRCALAVSSIGGVLLVTLVSPRRSGLLDVVAASVSLLFLLIGSVLFGLRGALGGLAGAEVLLSVMYFLLLRKKT
ncbi:hypothetical protein LY71_11026 [Geodermatophilus tzadiensis]|uniref:O-antigen/teichoic acid export membrane protein n=1 Tax=Geodermatophilus tzadiensis TaxID=1137988 RepID=A0A2T0TR25_9ACTN|nr:hypothetical protein [Geodermatophilus tzadiensis]PRY48140.1 hypothetical protein LY71_11026 [Geodermatophilus tzadiensis]